MGCCSPLRSTQAHDNIVWLFVPPAVGALLRVDASFSIYRWIDAVVRMKVSMEDADDADLEDTMSAL